jgi:CRP/FNR family transcriptional regulator
MENSCELCIYRSFLFDNLDKKEFALLTLSRKELEFKKGAIICREGEKINSFLYLKQGLLKIYKNVDHRREQIIGITKPRDFIGLLSAFNEKTHLYSISALEDSSICIIDIEAIKNLIVKDGSFALTLLGKMSKINDQILGTRLDINLKNLRGRTAYILLMFKEIYRSERYDIPVSRKEIAELIEMRTENVIRILSELRKDKIIHIEGKSIEILDLHRLEQISEFG